MARVSLEGGVVVFARKRSAVDARLAVPMWSQLVSELRGNIERGEYTDQFPTQTEIRKEFGVSLATVRQAVSVLSQEGYIRSIQGRGTFVIAKNPHDSILSQRFSLAEQFAQEGISDEAVVLVAESVKRDKLPAEVRNLIDKDCVHIERLRGLPDRPMAHEQVWLIEELGGPLLERDLGAGSLYDLLAQGPGESLTSGRDEVTATLLEEEDSQVLKVPPATPTLVITRVSFSGDRVAEYRRTLLAPSRMRFVSTWQRGGS